MFCFTNILSIFFSFVTCSMTHTKTQEMALKRLYFSKFSWGACPRTTLEVLAPSAEVGQTRIRFPKISKPVRLCGLQRSVRNADQSANNIRPTSSIARDSFTLKRCNRPLNILQDFVFTYFKQQRQCLCNYLLFELFQRVNKNENHHCMFWENIF